MVLIRRAIHFAAWIGTLLVGLLALALIVSQTPWFRDWIRRAIIREARQYVNGEVSIGTVTGNLFFDFGLADVAVDHSGDRVVAIKALAVDYSVFQLISGGIVVDRVTLTAPRVHLARGADGWNIGRLVKAREREADRRGPGRSISLPSIAIVDGTIAIDDDSRPHSYRWPRRIEDLDVQATFAYEPVHFTIGLNQFSFRGADPDLTVHQLTGTVAVRNDNLYLDRVAVKTGESALNIDGVIESYLRTPVIKLATDGTVSLPEVGRLVPALAGYLLHPTLVVNANGTLDRLLLDLHLTTEAGLVRGPLMTDLRSPDLTFSGPLHLERLNLAPILKNPAQRSDITGEVRIDLTLPSNPSSTPVFNRLGGTFTFRGPKVVAFGYEATQVRAIGAFKGPRITLADASVRAYGGSATTRGVIILPDGRRAVSYDLQGMAGEVDLRRLPASTRAPHLDTVLAIADYHVQGLGTEVRGSATLNRSLVEGATIESGTVVAFDTRPEPLTYAAQGTVAGLDVRRLGRALQIASLDDQRYAGRVNGTFDVQAAGTSLDELRLSARGTLADAAMWGTHVPALSFEAGIADSALTVNAKGTFDQLNPAVLFERKALDGNVNGTVDATLRWRDLSAPITPAVIDIDGRVVLRPSLIGGVQVAGAEVEGRYAAETADIARLHVDGPDVTLDASGRLALGAAGTSDLTYRINASDITELGRIAGRSGLDGTLALDGRVTGNAASLETAGTLHGNRLAYGENRVLDLDSTYAVAVADLDFLNARVQASSEATFLMIGGVELNQLKAKTAYAQQRLEFETTVQQQTRALGATGRVIFHPDHQELHLPTLALTTQGLSLGTPVIEWRNVAGSEATIRSRQNLVSIEDLRLANGDQTLDVSGAMAWEAPNAALPPDVSGATGSLSIHARNVDLAEAEALALQDRGLSGRLTADATITGSLRQPRVDGTVQITDGGFRAYKFQSLTADVGHGGNRISLDATLQQAPGIAITARGTVPTTVFQTATGGHIAGTPEDAIDIRLQTSALNLGVIQGFTTAVTQVGGTLEADVRITGSGNDPHVVGFLEVRDGAFAVPRLGTSYSGLDTRIDLETDVVRVRRFEILDENGEQLAVAGQLAVHERQIGAVDFTLESQNFEIIDNELGDLGVGTALKVTGDLTRPKLEGDIRVAAGRLEIDRILRLFYDPYSMEALPEVVSAARASEGAGRAVSGPPPQETGASASVFSNVALDVRVRIPDNLVARGRRLRPGGPTRAAMGDINITLGGDVNLRKVAGGPVTVAGTINTVRGTYQFQGRQFEIARNGTLRFTGGADFDPVLDLTATRQIPDTGVQARVRITGSLQAPALALSSTPPLEESDVLALIVFNRPINELGTGERASLAATAGGIATGFIAAPLGESIGRALDLDLFEITTSSEGDTFGAGFTVGEQIGSRTFLKLRQQFGDRTYSEFLLEYQITDFLRLVGSAAPETSGAANRIGQRRIERAGLDLIFFFSY